MNVPRPRRGRAARANALPAAIPAALLLTASVVGCGIRTTDVPVDGGSAPTRATCDAPAEDGAGDEVFLLCGSQVESVPRAVEPGGGDPGQIAEALLTELQSDPAKEEAAAGFRTEVPSDLNVSSLPGETFGTGPGAMPVLQLSRGPGDLPLNALFQIVCTFAHSEPLGNGQSAVLSGPPGSSSETPKEIPCTAAARAIPDEDAQNNLPAPPPGQEEQEEQAQDPSDGVAGTGSGTESDTGSGTGSGEAGRDPTG